MKIIEQTHKILTPINGAEILKHIERIGRVAYKSDDKITDDSAARFVKMLIERGHEEVKPPLVNPVGNIGGAVYRKAFVAHSEYEIPPLLTRRAVFFQHGYSVKQMPRVDR